jgi:hypothetical protein
MAKTDIEIDPGYGDGTHIQWLVVHSSETPETQLVHISCEHTDSLGRRVRDADQGVTFETKHLAKVIEALTLMQAST